MFSTIIWDSNVVYFDQQPHAWACVRMFENDKKQVFDNFRAVFIIFDHAFARQNTQQSKYTREKFRSMLIQQNGEEK